MTYNLKFASFGQRLLARLIDTVIVGISAGFIVGLLAGLNGNMDGRMIESSANGFGVLIYCFFYYPILESSGGTWGKRIVGIRTINLRTSRIPSATNSYGRALIYFLFLLLLTIPALLSGLAVLWSDKKQTWHDRLTNIAVIAD